MRMPIYGGYKATYLLLERGSHTKLPKGADTETSH